MILEEVFLISPTLRYPWFDQMIDFPRGVKVTGAGFPFYTGDMSKLVRALVALGRAELMDIRVFTILVNSEVPCYRAIA